MTQEVRRINLDVDAFDEDLQELTEMPQNSSQISKLSQNYTEVEDSEEEKYDIDGKRTPIKAKAQSNHSKRSSVEICEEFLPDPMKSPNDEAQTPKENEFRAENMFNEFERRLNEETIRPQISNQPNPFEHNMKPTKGEPFAENHGTNGSSYRIVQINQDQERGINTHTGNPVIFVNPANHGSGQQHNRHSNIQAPSQNNQFANYITFDQHLPIETNNHLKVPTQTTNQQNYLPENQIKNIRIVSGNQMGISIGDSMNPEVNHLGFDSFNNRSSQSSPNKSSQQSLEVFLDYIPGGANLNPNQVVIKSTQGNHQEKIQALQIQLQKINNLTSSEIDIEQIVKYQQRTDQESAPPQLKKPPQYQKPRSSSQKVIDSIPTVNLAEQQSTTDELFSSFSPKPKRQIYKDKVNIQKISPLDEDLSPMSPRDDEFSHNPSTVSDVRTAKNLTRYSEGYSDQVHQKEQTELIKVLVAQIEKLSQKLDGQQTQTTTSENSNKVQIEAQIKDEREQSQQKLRWNREKGNRIDYFGTKINHLINKIDELYYHQSPKSMISRSNSPVIQTNLNQQQGASRSQPSGLYPSVQSQEIAESRPKNAGDVNHRFDQDIYTLSSLESQENFHQANNRLNMSQLFQQSSTNQDRKINQSMLNSFNKPDVKPSFSRGNSQHVQYYGYRNSANYFPGKNNSLKNQQEQLSHQEQQTKVPPKLNANFLNIPPQGYKQDKQSKQSHDTELGNSKPIVEFDHNFPSSRDMRGNDIKRMFVDLESLQHSRSDFGTMERQISQDTTEHASFGAKAIQSSRFRQISSKCPTDEFSQMRSELKNYLPQESIEEKQDLRLSKSRGENSHIIIQDNDRYLNLDTSNSQRTEDFERIELGRQSSRDSQATSPEKTTRIQDMQDKIFNPLRAIRLLVNCHKSLVNTKSNFRARDNHLSGKMMTQQIHAYLDDLSAFKHNYYPIYYAMKDLLRKNATKDSKVLFKSYDPLFQSFYQVDNDTILSLHLDLKKELESAEEKLEKSLDLVLHGEMFERESRQGFFEGVRGIINKSVSSFAKVTKQKIKDYLEILNSSIGLQRGFDSEHLSEESFQESKLKRDYESWGIGNLKIELQNFDDSPQKKRDSDPENLKDNPFSTREKFTEQNSENTEFVKQKNSTPISMIPKNENSVETTQKIVLEAKLTQNSKDVPILKEVSPQAQVESEKLSQQLLPCLSIAPKICTAAQNDSQIKARHEIIPLFHNAVSLDQLSHTPIQVANSPRRKMNSMQATEFQLYNHVPSTMSFDNQLGSPNRIHRIQLSPRHNLPGQYKEPVEDKICSESGRKIISKRVLYNQMKPEDVEKYLQSQRDISNSPKVSSINILPAMSHEIQQAERQQSSQINEVNPFSHSHSTFVNLQNLHPDSLRSHGRLEQLNLTNNLSSSTFGVGHTSRIPDQIQQVKSPTLYPGTVDQSCQYPSINLPCNLETNRSGPSPNIPTSFSPPRGEIYGHVMSKKIQVNLQATPQPSKASNQISVQADAQNEQHELQKTVVKKVSGRISDDIRILQADEIQRKKVAGELGSIQDDFPSRPYPVPIPQSFGYDQEVSKILSRGSQSINANPSIEQATKNLSHTQNQVRAPKNRHNFILRKAEGTITTVKKIGSTESSGKVAVGFTSGDLIFTDINQIFKPEFQGESLKEEVYRLHSSSINSMEVVFINFKDTATNLKLRTVGLRKVLMTGGSESECSIIVWDLEHRKALKKLSGHKHQISCIVDLKDFAHVASSSFDSRVAIWDISNGFSCKKILDCKNSPILSLNYNYEMGQLLAGYMDGTINVWKAHFPRENQNRPQDADEKLKIHHIMEMTMSSHILKLELVKADPYDLLLVLGSDFQITIFALLPTKPKKVGILGSKYPIIDFKTIPGSSGVQMTHPKIQTSQVAHNPVNNDMGGFRLLAIDNRTNILEYGMQRSLKKGGLPQYELLHTIKSIKVFKDSDVDNKKVEIEQFFGSNPKTEVFLKHEKLGRVMLMKDQKSRSLVIQNIDNY